MAARLLLSLVVLSSWLWFPLVEAQAGAHAIATPPITRPGGSVLLLFEAPAPPLLEADVVQRVTCTLAAPDGTTTSCGQMDELVSARVQPSSRSYSFNITAPTAPGVYTFAFERKSLLSVPLSDAVAQTRITGGAETWWALGDAPLTGGAPPAPTRETRVHRARARDGARW